MKDRKTGRENPIPPVWIIRYVDGELRASSKKTREEAEQEARQLRDVEIAAIA